MLRVPADLHQKLVRHARGVGISLNRLCNVILEEGLIMRRSMKHSEDWRQLDPILHRLHSMFAGEMVGVAVFGSRVTGGATQESDTDLLISLDSKLPINRALYQLWDEKMVGIEKIEKINPHFIHYPNDLREIGGIWFEVAIGSAVLWEADHMLSDLFARIRTLISNDHVRRHWSNGHPYWVRQ